MKTTSCKQWHVAVISKLKKSAFVIRCDFVQQFFYGYTGLGKIILGRTVQVGRKFGWPSGLTDLPNPGSAMGSHQLTQSFIQLGLENLPRQRLQSLPGQPVQVLDCPHGEGFIPDTQLDPLSSTVSHSPAVLGRAQLRPLDSFLADPGSPLLGAPKAIPSPGSASPAPAASPDGAHPSASATTLACHWTHIFMSFIFWRGAQNSMQCFKYHLMSVK